MMRARADDDVLNYRAGLAPSAVYNTHRHKRSDKVWGPMDFFSPLETPEVMTPDEIGKRLSAFGSSLKAALKLKSTCQKSGRSRR
jgi:hypothetical protein